MSEYHKLERPHASTSPFSVLEDLLRGQAEARAPDRAKVWEYIM